MTSICLDSSGWIEITHAGDNARKFAKALSAPATLILSTINLYEIATLAASLSTQHKLAMADSLIYATTLNQNATLWTQDEDFKGLPHVKYFPKINS
jgi:toxin FitB